MGRQILTLLPFFRSWIEDPFQGFAVSKMIAQNTVKNIVKCVFWRKFVALQDMIGASGGAARSRGRGRPWPGRSRVPPRGPAAGEFACAGIGTR
jgi:hypothetical protein